MTEWWSYRLSDFLLFSPRVYWRLFELHNEAIWPLQLLTLGAGVAAIALTLLRPRSAGRPIALLLAILWAFVAWSFLWQRYATINWAAAYIAPIFGLEAVLLLILGSVLNRMAFGLNGARGNFGAVLLAFAVMGYPLLAPLSGRGWTAAEIFGIAPDPTAIATLGLLLLARGRPAVMLFPIPLLWCLVSAATLWAMDDPVALVPLLCALMAIVTALWQASRRAASRA